MSDFNMQHNRAVWFDVPVADLERAKDFYAAVLKIEVTIEQMGDFNFGLLQHSQGNGGCLVVNKGEIAPSGGILVYFNVDGRLREAVDLTTKHGGEVLGAIESLGPHGFRALVRDSEGNRIALHSMSDS